jgi:hypothetical protein
MKVQVQATGEAAATQVGRLGHKPGPGRGGGDHARPMWSPLADQ